MSSIKETYTATELMAILQISRQALEKRAARTKWSFEQRQGRGGGKAYRYAALPADVKAAIAKQLADAEPKRVLSTGAVIPEWSHKFGLARYQIVAGWRSYCAKQKAKGMNKGEATTAYLTAYNARQLAEEAFTIVGPVKKSTLYRWEELLRENGDDYYAICDRRGKWTQGGPKGLGQLTPEAERLFLSMWLTPNKPSVQLAYTGMEFILRRDFDQDPPSLSSVYRFSRRYEENRYSTVVLMREGEKALNDKVLPSIYRDRALLKVGDCLFADGHTLNFECLHPETGKPFRPTLLLWFDWKSGMPVGWEFMPTENIISVASSLLMAMRNLGMIPKVVYLDNGKAFKAKYFTKTDPDMAMLSGLYARLGIATQFATPYRGQVKLVERFFGTMNEQFSRLMPSYCGRDITDKPAWRSRNEKFHAKRHSRQDFVPTLEQAAAMFSAYVDWFGHMPNPAEKGLTCWDIFDAGRGPGVDLAELNREFLWTEEIRPRRCNFKLGGIEYTSDILKDMNHKVIVKFCWADRSVVYLYDRQGRSLGEAKPVMSVHPLATRFGTEHDKAMVADGNRRRNALKKSTFAAARALEKDLADTPGLRALPYNYRPERIEPPQLEIPEHHPVTDEEKAELSAIADAALASNHKSRFNKPEVFESKRKKYDWLYTSCMEGYEPESDEIKFMKEYEASREYQECVKPRYDQLRAFFGPLPQFGVGDRDVDEV